MLLYIILELLSARFVRPGGPQLTVLSFFNTSQNMKIKLLNLTFLNENMLLYIFSRSPQKKLILYFFLTTMTSELLKHLNGQLGVFLNVKQPK